MKTKQLNYFIRTDKYLLLMDNENIVSYQLKRLWLNILYFMKVGVE
jgi:hypothetical protein